ncbi:hypothetical protein [Prosthecodimorpha staleyi]|uniref:Uncharacterized protein n=1 Tax=Prosthecodimorpha staleyi TaxID=2840188 RepID=A0A947D9F9_9HYPH|nr:hypothetical protein [Prosthecodimorpha staleyi]MBT9293230.1 hypothetical protein [Prosthecodimorpha staleyi]
MVQMRGWIQGRLIAIDTAMLMLLAHHFPLSLGRGWATVRGVIHAALGYDWLSVGTGRYVVRPMTWRSLRRLAPGEPPWRRLIWLVQRYIHFSHAEWEGLALPRLLDSLPPPPASGETADRHPASRRGTIHFMFHYGSLYPVVAWLAQSGNTTNWITSDLYNRIPGLSPWIGKMHDNINQNLSLVANGGEVIFNNRNVREFYRKLRAGEDVVIVVDRTVASGPAIMIDLPGPCRVPLARGAWAALRATRSDWTVTACEYRGGRFHIFHERSSEGQDGSLPDLRLISRLIAQTPQRWWACHVLDFVPSGGAESG